MLVRLVQVKLPLRPMSGAQQTSGIPGFIISRWGAPHSHWTDGDTMGIQSMAIQWVDWIGLRENFIRTPEKNPPWKSGGFRLQFSLEPIH